MSASIPLGWLVVFAIYGGISLGTHIVKALWGLWIVYRWK